MELHDLFTRLFSEYSSLNPSVKKIHTLLEKQNEKIINDHIAFRTYNLPKINIDSFATAFEVRGYKVKGNYRFKEKKLTAKHYENDQNPDLPKIFISQLEIDQLSESSQKIIQSHYSAIKSNLPIRDELIISLNQWITPNYNNYLKLLEGSEYAAWLYAFGFRANHFTISVNNLKVYNDLTKLNHFLKKQGFQLNQSGGEIKGSKEQLLMQSSTLADIVEINFEDGMHQIPACYYEFAQRYKDTQGKLFQGFIASSADKIFESTNYRHQ